MLRYMQINKMKNKILRAAFCAALLVSALWSGCSKETAEDAVAFIDTAENAESTGANTGGTAEETMAAAECGTVLEDAAAGSTAEQADDGSEVPDWNTFVPTGTLELTYAQQFAVTYYDEYALITIANEDENQFLVVPEESAVPENLPEEITVLQQPLDEIYAASSAAMDLFRAVDGIGNVRLSGTKTEDWTIEEAAAAMESGEMLYAGKYSAPDYELLLEENCDLAVENTMIYHTPEVKEQLETLGIPVLVERTSYEAHPLGRMEWIKLYGVLLDQEELAAEYFAERAAQVEQLETDTLAETKTVAYFYVTSNGSVNIRKPGDYVSKMIELAGGEYAFNDIAREDNALSTMTIQMETFYAEAVDADYLIYNGNMSGEVTSMDDLLAKSELFADFKAVQEGNVWRTDENLFQKITGAADMILDFNRILADEDTPDEELTFLQRLR